jgi:hypothetical protein
MKNSKVKKEYIYNFIDGGWNSEFAYSLKEAIAQAKLRWGNTEALKVNEKSFRLASESEIKIALSNFY